MRARALSSRAPAHEHPGARRSRRRNVPAEARRAPRTPRSTCRRAHGREWKAQSKHRATAIGKASRKGDVEGHFEGRLEGHFEGAVPSAIGVRIRASRVSAAGAASSGARAGGASVQAVRGVGAARHRPRAGAHWAYGTGGGGVARGRRVRSHYLPPVSAEALKSLRVQSPAQSVRVLALSSLYIVTEVHSSHNETVFDASFPFFSSQRLQLRLQRASSRWYVCKCKVDRRKNIQQAGGQTQ